MSHGEGTGVESSDRSSRKAGGLRKPPGRGRGQLPQSFKSETRSTKLETNSNDKNSNDKNLKALRCSPLQNSLIDYYHQPLAFAFTV